MKHSTMLVGLPQNDTIPRNVFQRPSPQSLDFYTVLNEDIINMAGTNKNNIVLKSHNNQGYFSISFFTFSEFSHTLQ